MDFNNRKVTNRPTSPVNSNKCSFKTTAGLLTDQMLRQGRSTICTQIDMIFKENFPPHKFETAGTIEMTADREE